IYDLFSPLIKMKNELLDLKTRVSKDPNNADALTAAKSFCALVTGNVKIIYFELKTLADSFAEKKVILEKMAIAVKEGLVRLERRGCEVKRKSQILIEKINRLKHVDDNVKEKIAQIRNKIISFESGSGLTRKVFGVLKVQNLILLSKFE
ncbi:hypothetical protein EQH57_0621, partial [Dictyocoela roeselum]